MPVGLVCARFPSCGRRAFPAWGADSRHRSERHTMGRSGRAIVQEQWNDLGFRAFGMLLGAERSVLIIFNPTESTIQWTLPQVMARAGNR